MVDALFQVEECSKETINLSIRNVIVSRFDQSEQFGFISAELLTRSQSSDDVEVAGRLRRDKSVPN